MSGREQGPGLFIHHCISRVLINIWHTKSCNEYLLNKGINTEVMRETFELIAIRNFESLNW